MSGNHKEYEEERQKRLKQYLKLEQETKQTISRAQQLDRELSEFYALDDPATDISPILSVYEDPKPKTLKPNTSSPLQFETTTPPPEHEPPKLSVDQLQTYRLNRAAHHLMKAMQDSPSLDLNPNISEPDTISTTDSTSEIHNIMKEFSNIEPKTTQTHNISTTEEKTVYDFIKGAFLQNSSLPHNQTTESTLALQIKQPTENLEVPKLTTALDITPKQASNTRKKRARHLKVIQDSKQVFIPNTPTLHTNFSYIKTQTYNIHPEQAKTAHGVLQKGLLQEAPLTSSESTLEKREQKSKKPALFLPKTKTLRPILQQTRPNVLPFAQKLKTTISSTALSVKPISVYKISPLNLTISLKMPDLAAPTPINSLTSSIKPIPSPEPPVPIDVHDKIISLMKQFGYRQQNVSEGVCFGIASMASQAALLGQEGIDQFNSRIKNINTQYDKLIKTIGPYCKTTKQLKDLQKQQQQISASTTNLPSQKQFLEKLNAQIEQLQQKQKLLTDQNKDIIDLWAFFDGIYVYQKNLLSPEETSGLSQLTDIPDKFNILKPQNPNSETPTLNYQLQQAKTPFLGCFIKQELVLFLQDFNTHLQALIKSSNKQSIIFHIKNISHDVAIIYDTTMNKYFFVDSNFVDSKSHMLIACNPDEMQQLANHLFKALAQDKEHSSIAISINTYINNNSSLPIDHITQLNTTPQTTWSKALTRNDSTANNSTLLDLTNVYDNPSLLDSLIKSFDQTTKNNELIKAVYAQDIDLIKTLLSNGADINYNINGDTIFTRALYLNNPSMIEYLLTNSENKPIITEKILYYIIKDPRDITILSSLLTHNHLDQINKNKALLYAIYSANIEAISLLLSHGADMNFISENNTTLMHAISLNNPKLITALKKHQTTQAVVDEKMLGYAIETKNLKLLQYLLSQNSETHIINDALIRAITANNPKMIKALLLKGANINHEINGDTILTHAISLKIPDIITTILKHTKHTPKLYQNTLNHAIDLAKSPQNNRITLNLLKAGEFTDLQTKQQALLYAIKESHVATIKKLLTTQPSINIDETTLQIAINSNNEDIVLLLVQHAHLDNNTKNNALIQMVDSGKINIVLALLQQQAEVDYKDSNGYSTLTHALYSKNPDMVDVLLSYNTIVDENALNYAIEWGETTIITKLLANDTLDANIVYDALIYELVHSKRVHIINLLLKYLARTDIFNEKKDLLRYAINSRNLEIITTVLSYNPRIDQTALNDAIQINNKETIKLLLQKGTLDDETTLNTALIRMVSLGDVESATVEKLLKQISDINSNIMGKPILMHAIEAKNIPMIQFLLTQPNISINEQIFNCALQARSREIIETISHSNKFDEHTKYIALIYMMTVKDVQGMQSLLPQITNFTRTINNKSLLMSFASLPPDTFNENQSLLTYAIYSRNLEIIKSILKHHPIIDQQALNYAIKINDKEIIKLLLQQGTLSDEATLNTALIRMISLGDIEIATFKKLLKQIPDINSNIMGKPILMHAIDAKNISMIQFLLTQPNISINEQTFNCALQARSQEIIETISHSNKLDEHTKYIALIYMMTVKDVQGMQSLLPQITNFTRTINNKSLLMPFASLPPDTFNENQSLLTYAIHSRNLEIIKSILKHHPIIDQQALNYAIKINDKEIIKLLLQQGTLSDEATLNTALIRMVSLGEIALVNKLLKQKTDINSSITGRPILMHAIEAKNIPMIQFLLTQPNISINEQIFNYAIQSKSWEIIRILSGSNKLEESTKHIALIYMMTVQSFVEIKSLLSQIIDINRTINNKSLLMHAIDTNNNHIVVLLLQQPNILIDETILNYAKQKSGINDKIMNNLLTKKHQQDLQVALEQLNPTLFTNLLESIPKHIDKQQYSEMIKNRIELMPDIDDILKKEDIAQIKKIISAFQLSLALPAVGTTFTLNRTKRR